MEQCIYFRTNRLVRDINRLWDRQFKKHGLSTSHGYCLLAVQELPECTVKALALQLSLDLSTVSRFVEKLTANGWLEKQIDKNDKRVTQLVLTQDGQQLTDLLKMEATNIRASLLENNGEQQIKEYLHSMDQMELMIK